MFRLGATDHLQQSLPEGAFRRYGLSPDGAGLIPCVVEDLGKPVGGLDREWQRVGFRRGFLCAPVDGDSIAFDRSRATLDLDSRPCRDANLKEPCPDRSPKTSSKLATYLVSRSRTKNLAAMSSARSPVTFLAC